jgi:hypothetical protein
MNPKLFLGLTTLAAAIGIYYWSRRGENPPSAMPPSPSPEILQRGSADPFPAEPGK